MDSTIGAENSLDGDQRGPIRRRNDERWDAIKQDTHRIYITESKTLPAAIAEIEKLHGFNASVRKWKDKLKEWNFSKKLTEDDMKIVVAKVDKRSREGKATVVSHVGSEITTERIRNFKKRKTVKSSDAASPSAQTPEAVTYGTPQFNDIESLRADSPMELISEEPEAPEDSDISNLFEQQMQVPEQQLLKNAQYIPDVNSAASSKDPEFRLISNEAPDTVDLTSTSASSEDIGTESQKTDADADIGHGAMVSSEAEDMRYLLVAEAPKVFQGLNNLYVQRRYEEAIELCERREVYDEMSKSYRTEMYHSWALGILYLKIDWNFQALHRLVPLLAKALEHKFSAVPLSILLTKIRAALQRCDCFRSVSTRQEGWTRNYEKITENPSPSSSAFQSLDEMIEITLGPLNWDNEPFPPLLLRATYLAYDFHVSYRHILGNAAESLSHVGVARLKCSEKKADYQTAMVYYLHAMILVGGVETIRITEVIDCLLLALQVLVNIEDDPSKIAKLVSLVLKTLSLVTDQLFNIRWKGLIVEDTQMKSIWERTEKVLETCRSSFEVDTTELDMILHRLKHLYQPASDRKSKRRRKRAIISDVETVCSSSTGRTFNTSSTQSSKLGTTLSKSEFEGYSVGEMMGPYRE